MAVFLGLVVSEFDIDVGSVCRSVVYANPIVPPPNPPPPHIFSVLPPLSAEESHAIAERQLPEGCHARDADFTVFALRRGSAEERIWCVSIVRTTHSSASKRGAHVQALGLLSSAPWIDAMRPVLHALLAEYAAAPSDALLLAALNAWNAAAVPLFTQPSAAQRRALRGMLPCASKSMGAVLPASWSQCDVALPDGGGDGGARASELVYTTIDLPGGTHAAFELRVPRFIEPGSFHTASVQTLVSRFGPALATLYNAVLLEKRVLFLGSRNMPAGEVCNSVLACAHLVSPPLPSIAHRLFPYASLNDLDFLKVRGYIAGVTNPLFESKTDWWDVLCVVGKTSLDGVQLYVTPQPAAAAAAAAAAALLSHTPSVSDRAGSGSALLPTYFPSTVPRSCARARVMPASLLDDVPSTPAEEAGVDSAGGDAEPAASELIDVMLEEDDSAPPTSLRRARAPSSTPSASSAASTPSAGKGVGAVGSGDDLESRVVISGAYYACLAGWAGMPLATPSAAAAAASHVIASSNPASVSSTGSPAQLWDAMDAVELVQPARSGVVFRELWLRALFETYTRKLLQLAHAQPLLAHVHSITHTSTEPPELHAQLSVNATRLKLLSATASYAEWLAASEAPSDTDAAHPRSPTKWTPATVTALAFALRQPGMLPGACTPHLAESIIAATAARSTLSEAVDLSQLPSHAAASPLPSDAQARVTALALYFEGDRFAQDSGAPSPARSASKLEKGDATDEGDGVAACACAPALAFYRALYAQLHDTPDAMTCFVSQFGEFCGGIHAFASGLLHGHARVRSLTAQLLREMQRHPYLPVRRAVAALNPTLLDTLARIRVSSQEALAQPESVGVL